MFLKGQANVSIIIPNLKVYQSPQYSKKNKCHGHNRPLICPWTAPENLLAHPWHQRNIDAVDMTFFLMKLPPVCLWAASESPQEKNKYSGHSIFMMKLPPICPWADIYHFHLWTNWTDNCNFSLTLLNFSSETKMV